MENNEIAVPRDQLEKLIHENAEMKADIIEGAKLFSDFTLITGLNEGVNMGTLTLKLPKIIHKFQKEPELIEQFSSYLTKIKKYLPNDSPGTK